MKPDRDIDKAHPLPDFIGKLRRLADALETGDGFEIRVAGERVFAPARAVCSIGHEREDVLGPTTQVLERISSPTGTEADGCPRADQPGDGTAEVDNMDLLASQLQPIIDQMIASGINKIILQTRLQDIENEKLLATKLSGVDIVLGGGSSTRLGDATDVPAAFPGHDANFADTYPLVRQGLDGNPPRFC